MLRLTVVLAFLTVPQLAHASVAMVETEKLLGWSDDGQTWAVLVSAQADAEIQIKRRGKVVLKVCNRAEDESGMCKRGRKTLVVDVTGSKKLVGLERVNIETHKGLKRFKLQRVSSGWRTEFKKRFAIMHGPDGKHGYSGRRCAEGWTLTRKSDKKRIKRVRSKNGCLKTLGGYLSANGKYLLIKTEFAEGPTAESGDTYEGTSYVWVKL